MGKMLRAPLLITWSTIESTLVCLARRYPVQISDVIATSLAVSVVRSGRNIMTSHGINRIGEVLHYKAGSGGEVHENSTRYIDCQYDG